MNFENPGARENSEPVKIESSLSEETKRIELQMFNERISQFQESDLTQDQDGSWQTFEQKVREVFPECLDERFTAMKAAVTMHLCGM